MLFLEGILDLAGSVRLGLGRLDASLSEPLVRGERFEQRYSPLDIISGLSTGSVAGVAIRLQGADASAVLVPLVLPQRFIIAVVTHPVLVDVRQGRIAEELGHDASDVTVFTARVAELRVCAVTVIGPETMDSPGVYTLLD